MFGRMADAGVGGASHSDSNHDSTELWFSNQVAAHILHVTHYAYPIILLLAFLLVFTFHSVYTAADDTVNSSGPKKTGPGGKPLPPTTRRSGKQTATETETDFSRSQKLTFNWLLVGVIISFVGNAVNTILHALVKRPWWCGKATVVCSHYNPAQERDIC